MIIGLSERGLKIFCWVLFLVLSSAYLTVANAEGRVSALTIENTKTGETKDVFHVHGDFDHGLTENFKKLVEMYPDIKDVTLNSPGGVGWEGYQLGNVFSQNELNVRVSPGTYCLSACAIAFIGGNNYDVHGILGFHKGYIDGDVFEDQPDAFKNGSSSGNYHLYYILANGFAADLAFRIDEKTDPNKFIVFTDTDSLNEFFVRDDADKITTYLENLDVEETVFDSNDMLKFLENNPHDGIWKLKKELKSFHIESEKNV